MLTLLARSRKVKAPHGNILLSCHVYVLCRLISFTMSEGRRQWREKTLAGSAPGEKGHALQLRTGLRETTEGIVLSTTTDRPLRRYQRQTGEHAR